MSKADITVAPISDEAGALEFDVRVRDSGGSTRHAVTLSGNDFERLARPNETAAELVRRCFAFLLEREDKESILPRFDVSVIARYFPEFERVVLGERRRA